MTGFRRTSKFTTFTLALFSALMLVATTLQPAVADPIATAPTNSTGSRVFPATKPTTRLGIVPEVQKFQTLPGNVSNNTFELRESSRIIVKVPLHQRAQVKKDAERFSDELVHAAGAAVGTTNIKVVAGFWYLPRPGDIVLQLGPVMGASRDYRDSAYSLGITDTVTATAYTPQGLFYATRSIVQALKSGKQLPSGLVTDWATKPDRILHVDAGRKYFSLEWFKNQIRRMSYLKMNQLQYHFSENEGYRLESDIYPHIVSQQHLTKAELRELIQFAKDHYVEIVPAFDMPGHMEAILNHFPHFRASQTPEGKRILDYSNPEAVAMVKALIDEYAELFPSTKWHMGGDEVFDLESSITEMGERFPQLLKYAQDHAQAGEKANILDGYTYFLNELAHYLHSKGKTNVRAWNDALYWDGVTETLDARVTITYWSRWFKTWVSTERIRQHGHKLINFNGDVLYYVLTKPGKAYFIKPSPLKIYLWNVGVFPNRTGITRLHPQEEQNRYSLPTPQWITGAAFSIWADYPNVATEQEVSADIYPRLAAAAARMWKEDPDSCYLLFRKNLAAVGDPLSWVNPITRVNLS
ncbi:MAG: glycoside hydrolase family 20 protein [Lawsonella sp.]